MTKWRQAILSKLDGYSGFDIEFDDDHIIVCCKNAESFDVSFHVFGSEFQVSFDGWHEHFQSKHPA